MSEESGKSRGVAVAVGGELPPSQYYYGTFQGVANYQHVPPPPPPQLVVGFPPPAPSPGASANPPYYYFGYQTVPGYAAADMGFMREHRLPCCGIGIGWLLFLIGFFLGGIPWYVGAFILLCVRVDYREKPGLIACTIAALLAMIAFSLGVTKATRVW
ncbi:60S ribosomal protein L18a-like protein [Diospyros lotus]|uniref:60S ribosomal protein L18a-like protein n=1 Tax=Diospyros lotus TaxID=55363 RepID=UPI0022502DBE|nr:60S ribosomal protein L18a-like protein [Diospyros lotus]